MNLNTITLFLCYFLLGIKCAVVMKKNFNEITSQGLYHNKDKVTILGKVNFDQIYGQKHAWLVQFYNSFCGHCRAFSPNFKQFAADVENWKKVVRLGVVDCSVEDNVDICRQFEVTGYPSLRYMHENYPKGNTFLGESFELSHSPQTLTENLLKKLKDEHSRGRLAQAPNFGIETYNSFTDAMTNVPTTAKYTFMVFETLESTDGSKLLLDLLDYESIAMKRILSTSKLAKDAGVTRFPGLIAVRNNLDFTPLTPKNPSRASLLHAIDIFLESKNMPLPERQSSQDYIDIMNISTNTDTNQDKVNIADLETTLKSSLHTEITRYKELQGEALQALLAYLTVLIDYFPFRANGKEYLIELKGTLTSRALWSGDEIANLVRRLESSHAPVYSSRLDYINCRGSEARYRGYSCGLWTMFHTLTVSAATKSGGYAPDVLRAMHGYVKHFFGCTECSQHFQDMAHKNKIFEVQQSDKAVLWLWISHNEVNLRLAGDETEDPAHPKIQFPSAARCPECREPHGSWRLPAVYRYLRDMYKPSAVQTDRPNNSSVVLSPLDFSITAILYIFSFTILILACMFFSKTRRLLFKGTFRRHNRPVSKYSLPLLFS